MKIIRFHYFISRILNISLVILIVGCTTYPDSLKSNFKQAGKNQSELKKVIRHYSTHKADSVKKKAAIFLIQNMDAHESYKSNAWDSYQADLNDLFKKEDRPAELSKGFNQLYKKYTEQLNDINYVSDLESINAKFLISNIDEAFKAWKSPNASYLTFDEFCEYLLPYRAGTEPLGDWRMEFKNNFNTDLVARITTKKDSITARKICDAIKTYPHGTIMFMPGELPDYNTHTLSLMKIGNCRLYSLQGVLAARSLGIPVTLDYTPQWATRAFGHEWNALIAEKNKPLSFGIGDFLELGKHEKMGDRIAAKVYRETYAKQPNSLMMIHEKEEIPNAFMSKCIKDVTRDYYTDISNVSVKLILKAPAQLKFTYLSVFDNKNWTPIAWARNDNNSSLFNDMHRGIACLPSYYFQGKVTPAAYPIIIRTDGKITNLKPDLKNRQSIILNRKYQFGWGSYRGFAMLSGKFQVANDSNFSDAIDIYEIKEKPEQFYQVVDIQPTAEYKYFRYFSPKKSYGEVAEVEVYESGSCSKLIGKIIGNNHPQTDYPRTNAFDGNTTTRFKTAEADSTWIGLAFDTPKKISRIVYLPTNDDNCVCNGQTYELLYWDNKWVSLGKQTGSSETYRLKYDNVPTNALFLLRNLTKGKEERIFTYEDNKQVWW